MQDVGASSATGGSVDMDGSEPVRSTMQVVPEPETIQEKASSDTGDAVGLWLNSFFEVHNKHFRLLAKTV
jgi:hypothetical protein